MILMLCSSVELCRQHLEPKEIVRRVRKAEDLNAADTHVWPFSKRQSLSWGEKLPRLTQILVNHNRSMTVLGHASSPFCTAGCARCCAMLFYVSPAETAVIADWLLKNPEILQRFSLSSVERERVRRENEKLWLSSQKATTGDDPSLRSWYSLDIRCAFNHDGVCSIYPVRPLACSLYNSIVPAEYCATEPKSYESDEMKQHQADTRIALAREGIGLPPLPFRLDVSWLVQHWLENVCRQGE